MKVLLVGGGTGGHFYPLIAVAEEIQKVAEEKHLVGVELHYMAPTPYDKRLLFEHGIEYHRVSAGKRRTYFSLLNIIDFFKMGFGVVKAFFSVYRIFPDVVFSKGGYVSVPPLVAARFFGIPVVIHESDSVPGRANLWAAKFARRVAVSYPKAGESFPAEKVAVTGNPIRREIAKPQESGAHEFLHLDEALPTILILGGSQGAERINNIVLDALPRLLERFQLIHQTGAAHFDSITQTAQVVLDGNPHADRYHPFAYLNTLAMKMAAGAADIVVSRAGSSIFEIAAWGKPSIIIPIPEGISRDQRTNAFSYARAGAALVIEEENLTPNVFIAEITRFLDNKTVRDEMAERAKRFARLDAAHLIADEIVGIALRHER